MNCWLIIRTELRKEIHVAAAIARLGYDAWVPLEAVSRRIHRKHKPRAVEYVPVIPKTIFAAIPAPLEGSLHGEVHKIRGVVALMRDSLSQAFCVPANHIQRFREEIDALNRETLALIAMDRPRRKKAEWHNLHDALLALVHGNTPVDDGAISD